MREYFNVRFTRDHGRESVWKAIVEDIAKRVPLKGTVLDCGTGWGSFINNVVAKERIAIDLENAGGLEKGVKFHKASITSMKIIRSNSIDVVFASNLLEHLGREEVTLACKEVQRVLKKGGQFICLQPNFRYAYRSYFDDYTHISIFTDVSLPDRLAAEGLTPVVVKPRYLPLTMKSRLPKSYWMTKLYLALPFKPLAGQMLIIAKK